MVNGIWAAFTLEDTYQKKKIPGQTRIPEGIYNIVWHNPSKFESSARSIVREYIGMPMLENVPGFSYVLIHVGNTHKHTDGCILVGKGIRSKTLVVSKDAFASLYDRMVIAKRKGEKISIEIIDLEEK